ncbi:MAG: Protein of unknown function (DUF2721) [Idiomarinaceae bacterium HL-53]|nr:MAG: Protein of unknown function (DUF2721) [Idiomarinaceae bacterium HL-53]CUS47347.1 hypothetical protein Ga0003345_0273 [Idiomarinaceae bacterium HL-53]
MSKDNLDELTNLWQSEAPETQLDTKALKKRYRLQRWLMGFNVVSEIVMLVVASIVLVWLVVTEASWHTLLWVGFVTLWGWGLFLQLNLSRWRSFNLMKNKAVYEMIQEQVKLVEQELLRWKISFYGTLGLLVVYAALALVRLFSLPLAWFDMGVDLAVIALLAGLAIGFRYKQKSCEGTLKILQF